MSQPSSRLIEGRQLGVRLGGKSIISGVDIRIDAGKIVTLIGPNGAGKSTLIKALLGVHKITDGEFYSKANLSIGYMPQRVPIDDSLPLAVHRLMTLTHRASRDQVSEALALTEVAHLIDRPVQQLSGGEFQRVMLARALLKQPDLLVLDEPVQGVDFSGEVALYKLIQRLRDERGYAVLMVSHDLHLVMAATDEVLCLNGHLCCSGTPESITQEPTFTSLFGPHQADALAFYSHHHDHEHDLAHQGGHSHD
ncbi:zinc ABC transporter ATP-binding protein ZnuC [Saccharospirillum sp. HFRX-1]|uniref:zinc ABC transporter ATP-binding protein ZnuC n=1 Tax=unclassified Saccharospirillum TaxID=2633430 RepID=UPI003713D5A3